MTRLLIKERSKNFSLKIIEIVYILKKRKEYVISHQLYKSGTSIGANIAETVGAESKKDFIHKYFIAYKEAQETKYWLDLLLESPFIMEDQDKNKLHFLCKEIIIIIKILNKIIYKLKNSS